jgi:two-component system, LytTR family, sensor kinase
MSTAFQNFIRSQKQDAIIRFIMNKKWAWVRHVLLLGLIITNFYPFFSIPVSQFISEKVAALLNSAMQKSGFLMIVVSAAAVYINVYILVPRLLFKARYFYYTLVLTVMLIGYFVILYGSRTYYFRGIEEYTLNNATVFEDFISVITTPLVFIGATSGYKIFKKWITDSGRLNALQQSQLNNELTHLKNQVNPHFLFNTLNNIRTLNEIDIKKANQVLLGLSDILRYQIYDSNKALTSLQKDIEMLNQYLMLEKIRRDDFKYEIVAEGTDNKVIPPLLFINFIENAIKHGANSREASFCNIKFATAANTLAFSCINSKPSFIAKNEKGGLGIKNIERRLELLYGDNYALHMKDETNLFTVHLTIPV